MTPGTAGRDHGMGIALGLAMQPCQAVFYFFTLSYMNIIYWLESQDREFVRFLLLLRGCLFAWVLLFVFLISS